MTFDLKRLNMWKRGTLSQRSTNVVLFLGVFLSVLLLCVAKPKGDLCVLSGQQYRVGETWHPKVSPVEKYCVNCSCLEGGEVKCTSVSCEKPDCEDPKYVPGECCPVCEVVVERDSPESSPLPGCEHDGAYHDDGEIFPSNKTAFKPLHSNQCVLCACYKGEVFCHLKSCLPQPGCLNPVAVSDDCCHHCEEYEDEVSVISKEEDEQVLAPGDCMSQAGPQKNGSSWKPIVGPYGEMDCVLCHCQNGRVNCSRIQCPSDSILKCKRPQLRKGNCCKECPKGRGRRGKKKSKKKKKKNRKNCSKRGKNEHKKENKGKKKRRKCKKKNRKKQERTLFPADTRLDVAKPKLCTSGRADYLVYVLQGDNSFSLILDVVGRDSMEKIDWTFHKGRISTTKRTVVAQPNDVRQMTEIKHLLGSTTKRYMKRFFKRLDRKLQKCKHKCRRRLVEKSVKKLRVRLINLNKTC